MEANEIFRRFTSVLNEEGPRASLAYLVGLTDYRFIGLFQFHDGMASAPVYYDRENPQVLALQEVPDTATYCWYVRERKVLFSTSDARADPRLADHPARAEVLAYCGVPVMDPEGILEGILCLYDVEPRDPEQLDPELLVQVASTLQQRRCIPPHPVKTASATAEPGQTASL